MKHTYRWIAGAMLALVLFTAGCGNSDRKPGETAPQTAPVTETEAPTETAPVTEAATVPETTVPATPEPVDMLGGWELAWTEVEGDWNEAEPGAEEISIFLNDQNGLRITLTSRDYPEESFTDKELAAFEEEMYPGCGNDQWVAYVGYTGLYDTIYSVTLLQDDTLLLRLYWEMDGAPMVAYKGYRRMP